MELTYQSEAQLENKLIDLLVDGGYKRIYIKDEEDLILNFREQLNLFNIKNLENEPLTDAEFERFLTQINGKSIFASSKILRMKQELARDDGTKVFLELMNTNDWCKNNFQISNQTTMEGKYVNRYDVTLFINGLPLVQIELKRRGLDFKEAFNQIQRYRRHSYKSLYRYIQIFVISNGVDTKYFANSDGEILFSQTFYWSDKENNRITTLSEFGKTFLEKCHMSKMVSRYMVLNETDKMLMVMRPYQVYAVEELIKRALETKNNGYIWHTTGSGKTLTSFKASQILANEPGVDKVFFLVDRRDLDSQTEKEFNKFEPGSVDSTDNTRSLIKQIKDLTKPLIITTIQKMANAVNLQRYKKTMEPYKDKRVIFIIDECHRTQFGKMHRDINRHFQNSQYFGFTGTPRLIENKAQDGRTTADIFETCLHHYLIKDAIHDGNVLGFSVDYIKTFDADIDEGDLTKVPGINKKEVWDNEERLELIAKYIIETHNRKSKSKGYNALFAVDSIDVLIKYYDMFKKLDHNLKIAGIFTYGANEDLEEKGEYQTEVEHSRESMERMIIDYNSMFDTNFSTNNYDLYRADVDKKVRTAKIDLLLVVRMFLTGFDSKKLNILYVDKFLKHHELLQAYSRTNRVERMTKKPYGNIICFRNLKEETDEAIRIFSKTDNVDTVLAASFEEYLELFKAYLEKLIKIAPAPSSIDSMYDEKMQKEFIIIFRELTKYLVRLETFDEFEFTKEKLGISDQEYQDYRSKYLSISDSQRGAGETVSILDDVDFALELMHTDKINVSYIMNLIRNIDLDNEENRDRDVKEIIVELDRADSVELRYKVDLLKEFLTKVVPTLTSKDSIDNSYNEFEAFKREREIDSFSQDMEVSNNKVKDFIEEYEFSGIVDRENISESLKGRKFMEKIKLTKKIENFIFENTSKYA